ncbi:hypothetical protein [Kallipyga massiliensis]|uniref:hypothetical protein n=1 Tax=Kallipyga massiliensis TaxID=1472764 RepID=UPI00155A5D04|nr:hypothetical protein [Kallipyga massiliensis]
MGGDLLFFGEPPLSFCRPMGGSLAFSGEPTLPKAANLPVSGVVVCSFFGKPTLWFCRLMGGDLGFFGKPTLSLVAKRSSGLAFFDKPPLFVGNKIGVISYSSQKNNR